MKANGDMGQRAGELKPAESLSNVAPESLGSIVAAASDITLIVDEGARVVSLMVNDSSTDFGKLDHWIGRPLSDFLTSESVPKFEGALQRLGQGGRTPRAVELNHRDNAVWDFPVQYSFHKLGPDNRVLMLGRDLRPVAETQRQLVQAQLALERGYEAQREFDSRYRLLLASVTDAIALVSLSDGRITDMNDRAADVLGSTRRELVGSVFAAQFADIRRGEMDTRLVNAALSDDDAAVDLATQRDGRSVRVVPHVFRVGGDRVAICRLVRAEDRPLPPSGGLAATMELLFAAAVEAILITDETGTIRTGNDRFLAMVDAAHQPEIRGRQLSEFLARGQVDLSVLLENIGRAGHVRLYVTELVSDFGSRTPVEMSATLLRGAGRAQIAFVFRDAGRVEAVRLPSVETETAAQQNILELVGSASLKEIVAETNDVIEKLCIETAIRLTNNNRVAAAEMLGLSRQSLYVKLRKYNLVKKADDH